VSVVRGSSLRARLSRTLVGLGLVSVLLLAGVNFLVVRTLIDTNVNDQLVTLRNLRKESIELGIEGVLARVSVMASDPGVVKATEDLGGAYSAMDNDIGPTQLADLVASYDAVVARYDEAGVERPPVEELVPDSPAGRYLQYHYVAANPFPIDERDQLTDAGDGTSYSSAHADYHPFLRSLRDSIDATDLLIVGAASDDVIYSASKLVDLGTDTSTGPYRDTGLGTSLTQLQQAAITDAVIVDSRFYLPDSSAPIVHVAATIRADAQVIGAIVVEIPIGALTDIVTADQQWDLLGLGDTGEAYVVGPDLRLRTVPRAWFEDSNRYLRRFTEQGGDQRTVELFEFTGSPVLLQSVDNQAVREAFDGEDFVGVVDNYLGRRTLAATAPLDLPGLDWVVVTEQQTAETNDELGRFLVTIALVLAVLLPILAIVGLYLARMLARPVGPLVDAAGQIAAGDLDAEVPDLGRNELGDLGRQLRTVASQLRDHEQEIAHEEQGIASMLESVLPPTLVTRIRSGEPEIIDQIDTGTVISLTIRGLPVPVGAEQDAVLDLTTRLANELRLLAAEHGVDRIRVGSDRQLFVSGLGEPGPRAEAALAFATAAIRLVDSLGSELGVELSGQIGMTAGQVATGVLGSQQASFGIWGECVGAATTLSAHAAAEILVDRSVIDELDAAAEGWGAGWVVSPFDASSTGAIGFEIEALEVRPVDRSGASSR